MPDYSSSKIYKIVSPSNPDLIYYGSTTQKLCVRMAGHRRHLKKGSNISSKQILCFDDAIILLVENFSCNSKEELHKKEGEYILNNKCVNKVIAGRNAKEYREDNKDKIKQYRDNTKDKTIQYKDENKEKLKDYIKKYREDNKDKIKEKLKQYRENNKEKIKAINKEAYVIRKKLNQDV